MAALKKSRVTLIGSVISNMYKYSVLFQIESVDYDHPNV